MKLYKDADSNLNALKNKKIAVLGYGNQGKAQAQNLKDSGLEVIIGLKKESDKWQQAQDFGFEVFETSEAVKQADIIHILIPDEKQPKVFEESIKPNLSEGNTISFSTGFGIHFGYINPPENVNVVLVVPFSPGKEVRTDYLKQTGGPGMFAVNQDVGSAKEIVLGLAKACGFTKRGVLESSFEEEAIQNLFGEQAAICGGQAELLKASFDTVVKAGYSPEIAYLEVVRQMNLLSNLIKEGGINFMWESISNTAEYGGRTRGKKIIDDNVRKNMEGVLEEIKSGKFAREWMEEEKTGLKKLTQLRKEQNTDEVEIIGEKLRKEMK